MFDAQTIFGGTTVYSPWFPRGGDYLRATVEAIKLTAAGLEVRVFTKKQEDTTSGADVDSSASGKIATTGTTAGQIITHEWGPDTGNGINELVRYEFKNTASSSSDWILFRMLPPVWFDAVEG